MDEGGSRDWIFEWSVTNLALGMFGMFPLVVTVGLVSELLPPPVRRAGMDPINYDDSFLALMMWAPLLFCWTTIAWIVNWKLRQRNSLRRFPASGCVHCYSSLRPRRAIISWWLW